MVNIYNPTTISHPVESLKQMIAERRLSRKQFGALMGVSKQTVDDIYRGSLKCLEWIVPRMAQQGFGDESFWRARIRIYREHEKDANTKKATIKNLSSTG